MTDNITLVGVVATPPKLFVTTQGLAITSFRLASAQRKFDRTQNKWVDADTNWYSVSAFRGLAHNAFASLKVGERVFVSGKLKIREWTAGAKSGTNIEVEAESLGHDLVFGTTAWTRTSPTGASDNDPADAAPDEFAAADGFSADSAAGDGISGLDGVVQNKTAVNGAAMNATALNATALNAEEQTVDAPF